MSLLSMLPNCVLKEIDYDVVSESTASGVGGMSEPPSFPATPDDVVPVQQELAAAVAGNVSLLQDSFSGESECDTSDLPSIGSAGHFTGECKRCCFQRTGRCQNGYNCEFCHFDHEKRIRKKKKKSANSGASVSPPAPPPGLDFQGSSCPLPPPGLDLGRGASVGTPPPGLERDAPASPTAGIPAPPLELAPNAALLPTPVLPEVPSWFAEVDTDVKSKSCLPEATFWEENSKCQPYFSTADPNTWTVRMVTDWLHSNGLSNQVEVFAKNRITGDLLLDIQPEELQAMGVFAMGDRKRILRAIGALKAQQRQHESLQHVPRTVPPPDRSNCGNSGRNHMLPTCHSSCGDSGPEMWSFSQTWLQDHCVSHDTGLSQQPDINGHFYCDQLNCNSDPYQQLEFNYNLGGDFHQELCMTDDLGYHMGHQEHLETQNCGQSQLWSMPASLRQDSTWGSSMSAPRHDYLY